MVSIPRSEFVKRVENLRGLMRKDGLAACIIYGDEYRRENLRYVSNYWPLFERGALIVPPAGEPIMAAAPEGEMICREMGVWDDIRLLPDFACVTVPDEIEYPQAAYTSFRNVFEGIKGDTGSGRIGVVGLDSMSYDVFKTFAENLKGCEIIDANNLLFKLRLKKSENEIACLTEASRIAESAYKAIIGKAKPGMTELELEGTAHYAAKKEGAEYVPFCLISSGERVNNIIGRATDKKIEDGDMVMAALAIQYQGYVATMNFPFVVGKESPEQRDFIKTLVEGYHIAVANLKGGSEQKRLVKKVKDFFAAKGMSKYDIYPPLHGCGVAEAESPYPNEGTEGVFEEGMTVNIDLSLFGHKNGSNRIEAGFVITRDGALPMSGLIDELSKKYS